MKRRSFINIFLGGSVLVAAGGAMSTLLAYLWPPNELTRGDSSKQMTIPLADLPVNESKKIPFKGKPFIVIRAESGVVALSAACTHLGCLVNWDKDKKELICPCHSAKFDLRGNVIGGPAPSPLESAPVKISGDTIIIGEI